MQKFCCQKITKPNVTREKLLNMRSYEKRQHKMLMKLTQGQEFFYSQSVILNRTSSPF